MISFHHDKWGWSQSLYTPISVHLQENTVPVQDARSKVQNIAQVIHNKDTRILQYGRFSLYSCYFRIIIIHCWVLR